MDNNQNHGFNENSDPNQTNGFNSNQNANQGWQQPQFQAPPQYSQPYPPYPPTQTEPPMSIGQWILTILVLMIPCVNIIMLFVWAFGSDPDKKSRANYCKARLILIPVMFVLNNLLYILLFSIFSSYFIDWLNTISQVGSI